MKKVLGLLSVFFLAGVCQAAITCDATQTDIGAYLVLDPSVPTLSVSSSANAPNRSYNASKVVQSSAQLGATNLQVYAEVANLDISQIDRVEAYQIENGVLYIGMALVFDAQGKQLATLALGNGMPFACMK